MKSLKAVLVSMILFCFYNVSSQNVPPEVIGTWKISNVYATDSTGTTDTLESDALMDDLVNNNVFEYQFTDSTFTLIVNSAPMGTCHFTLENGRIVFDANGENLSDVVQNLSPVSVTPTTLELTATSQDGNGILFHQSLVKQP